MITFSNAFHFAYLWYLLQTELLDQFTKTDGELPVNPSLSVPDVIGIRDAAFTWAYEKDGTLSPSLGRRSFTLRIEDELVFERGRINLILGPTGSGKTSLLMALLGEISMQTESPKLTLHV